MVNSIICITFDKNKNKMINIEEFKELFLKLTEYTIPFGYEHKLEKYLPSGFKKDSTGNYYYVIGESDTLFTTHLDTYSEKYKKVNHVIDGYKISTDKTTILGGDNKLGTSILISMINEGKPGTYYFFLGEEPIGKGGLYGSRNALNKNPEFFKKFKRAIAFDRREYGSIVTRQMGRNCCSMEFATQISKNLKSFSGIEWDKKGGYGYYTDTAVLMDVIPEITNLSVGGFKEHHNDEYVDLVYTYAVLNTALKMDWETLPVVREIDNDEEDKSTITKNFISFNQNKLIKDITSVMDIFELSLTRKKNVNGKIELTYSMWLQDFDLKLSLEDESIIFEKEKMNYQEFLDFFIKKFGEDISETIDYYVQVKQMKEIDKIIKTLNCKDIEELYNKIYL